ncbi:hypothetical protein [Paenibacillus wynnii]|uniref:hypothetical protein n=1 Tax=Paenibacillus wynnii TaxID=268407 RepID=UPI002794E88E|nr:hypothetical protein [Paenibacillus wynnii]MDQ0194601.1 hypothetical protein [Paenibacillus wynnii]
MIHPDLYEFEYLFECDATGIEQGIPWVYCGATFDLSRLNRSITFSIEIGGRCSTLELFADQNRIITLKLENIKEIQIIKNNISEGLKLEFDDDNYVLPLLINTKPEIYVDWGTSLELQR